MTEPNSSEKPGPNKVMKSVDRALSVLRYFTVAEPELGLSDITRRAELDKATMHRILTALTRNGLLEQISATKKYRLGAEALRLARVREASIPLSAVISPILLQLSTECGETAHATLGSNEGMLTIGVSEPQRATRVYVDPSATLPFYASASGQIYSAFVSHDNLKAILEANRYEQFTTMTPKGEKDFLERIDKARRAGFAVSQGTFELDTVGVAAPFFDASERVVGAVAVAGVSSRMDSETIERVSVLVRAAAKNATAQLGGRT